MRTGISQLLLRLQRIPWRPPPRLFAVAKRLFGRAWAEPWAITAGWTTPIIDRGQVFVPLEEFQAEQPTIQPVSDRPIGAPDDRWLPSRDTNLRCAFVLDGLWPGGVSEFVMLLARHLPAHGIDVAIVDCDPAAIGNTTGRYQRQAAEACIPILDGSSADGVTAAFRSWKPDVLCEQGLASPMPLEIAAALGIPIVEVLHGMHSYLDGFTETHRRASERTSVFVAVSELMRTQYLSLDKGISPHDILTIPNALDKRLAPAVDRDQARRLLGFADEFVAISLARYSLQKNIAGLVAAFSSFAQNAPDAHLIVAGHTVDHFQLAQAMMARSESRASDRIHLRGETSAPDVLVAAADVFVLDSFFEGWSLAAMDAIYLGVPIVTSEVAGAAEQVGADGRRGRMVANPLGHAGIVGWDEVRRAAYRPQPNVGALHEALFDIYQHRQVWLDRRSELLREASDAFSVNAFVQGHADVLTQVAKSSRATLSR